MKVIEFKVTDSFKLERVLRGFFNRLDGCEILRSVFESERVLVEPVRVAAEMLRASFN